MVWWAVKVLEINCSVRMRSFSHAVAYAPVMGGGELGEAWSMAGRGCGGGGKESATQNVVLLMGDK